MVMDEICLRKKRDVVAGTGMKTEGEEMGRDGDRLLS